MRLPLPWQPWRLKSTSIVKQPLCSLQRLRYSRSLPTPTPHLRHVTSASRTAYDTELWVGKEIKDRLEELGSAGIDLYPQLSEDNHVSMSAFDRSFQSLGRGETKSDRPAASHYGRVESVRIAGSSLFFVTLVRKNFKLQVVFNHARLSGSRVSKDEFKAARKLLRRGDILAVSGYPHRTESGELSVQADVLPRVLSPCLHQFPVTDRATKSLAEPHFIDKHVDMLAHHEPSQIILCRSQIIYHMREFLRLQAFVEVQTPILAPMAGGAVARPFETAASESPERKLSLRVAPELWLKRLILGGMDRVFEIGPSFRNEGVDKLHNPEFTTCEFYSAYTSCERLLKMTENMLNSIVMRIEDVPRKNTKEQKGLSKSHLPPLALPASFFKGPYPCIDFIPALNVALGLELPDLTKSSAVDDIVTIFKEKGVPLPSQLNLPRLLDKLSTVYLEPQCDEPTWIINHPECLSPLSKSAIHPSTNVAQPVAARAELFIHGKEIVNCYEEENSPFEQRRKFMMQQEYASVGEDETLHTEAIEVDEEYLKALEWGLPPTAGWGCGVDRLIMLLTGQKRINDVLPLGNLKSISRTREARKMVRVQLPDPAARAQRGNTGIGADTNAGTERVINDKTGFTPGPKRMSRPSLDAAEQAVIDVKQKFGRRKASRHKQRGPDDTGPTLEHKRLAAWLDKREPPGAAERFLDP